MALLDEKQMFGSGIVKELEESAISLVLQNLQQDQYQYPEKSFIREIVSNCVDAIEEKKVAISILTGETTVEDHYSTVESDITRDSKFNPEYYSLDHLSSEDKIEITYVNRYSSNRDRIIIEDTGVGLGGSRLQGFFKPAFSSKRLNKKALGKWGIGSKSGLSTGVESYQMVSRYNGREYQFDIYNDRFFSTVSEINVDTFNTNPHELWKVKVYTETGEVEEKDLPIYYLETSKPNGVTISIDVKNPVRNKEKYINAVKTQLNYFQDVKLFECWENEEDKRKEIHFRTDILYKDDHLIIPKDNYYAVPHLVINNVVYGTVDFAEMEMDEKRGNIGIIADPSEIDVNQSRETVRYTEKTRNSIKKYLENAINIAQNHINEELKTSQDDFLKWIIACKNIKAKPSNLNVFSRLSGLADLSKVEFLFEKDGIKFIYNKNSFKDIFNGYKVTKTVVTKTGNAYKTATSEVHSWEDFHPETSVVMYRSSITERISSITMGYLRDTHSTDLVYLITKELEDPNQNILTYDVAKVSKVAELIKESTLGGCYDDVIVPDEFLAKVQEEQKKLEDEETRKEVEASMTEKDMRKRNGTILYHYFTTSRTNIIDESYITKKKFEISVNDVSNMFSKETTVFGTSEDIPLILSLLHTIGESTRVSYRPDVFTIGKEGYNFIVVAKENVKYFNLHATYVKEAIQKIEGTKISVMNQIKNYNTARLLKYIKDSKDFEYLNIFDKVDSLAFETYQSLKNYATANGFSTSEWRNKTPGADSISEYLDNLAKFQLSLIELTDPVKIAEKSQEFFNTPNLDSCDALNMEVYTMFKALEDYTDRLKTMLRPYSYALKGYAGDKDFSHEAIKEYIQLKQIPEFSEFLKAREEEFKTKVTITQEISETN